MRRYDPSKICESERRQLLIAIGDAPVKGGAGPSRDFSNFPTMRAQREVIPVNPRREHVPVRRR